MSWKRFRGVTGTPGTTHPRNSFLTLSWTPGADEHQERGGRIEGGHVVTKPFQTAVKKALAPGAHPQRLPKFQNRPDAETLSKDG